ncbi:GTP-binding protein Rhes isoform X2 [Anolis carolinensis]|uniref:GTP-binding protein Rhes isoform X2 n=1 Tax=Anolis carolinensis TaxID=28377 RepID=UPI002F2B3579
MAGVGVQNTRRAQVGSCLVQLQPQLLILKQLKYTIKSSKQSFSADALLFFATLCAWTRSLPTLGFCDSKGSRREGAAAASLKCSDPKRGGSQEGGRGETARPQSSLSLSLFWVELAPPLAHAAPLPACFSGAPWLFPPWVSPAPLLFLPGLASWILPAMSFPRPLRRSVSLNPARTLRLVVLGQGAVGKTEMIYRHTAVIDSEMVHFEILDTAGQEEDSLQIEEKIKWGDGFAVVYSVTDRCSFDEVMRLCFLINHIHSSPKRSNGNGDPPVVIVGNKKDLQFDRMVSFEDGENLSKALKHPFYEISTRDSYEETVTVFNTLYSELMKQGHFSPGAFKRRAVSKLMEKIPKIHANSTLASGGRSLSFNSFRDYIPE